MNQDIQAMDVEEIHTILIGATRVQQHMSSGRFNENAGADYNLTLKWFKHCGIIDGLELTEEMFTDAYERLAPNREELTLTQMVTLFSIFARETRKDVDYFALKFERIKDDVIEEIRDYWRALDEHNHPRTESTVVADDNDSDHVKIRYVLD